MRVFLLVLALLVASPCLANTGMGGVLAERDSLQAERDALQWYLTALYRQRSRMLAREWAANLQFICLQYPQHHRLIDAFLIANP